MKKRAFTLAEVLITLAIIGVVAAISIPSVVANTQQKEFQTGLRKAVSVLNSAITMNMAIDGETPYENGDLYRYLARHMSVMKSSVRTPFAADARNQNISFYTTDGMRFDFPAQSVFSYAPTLYENASVRLRGVYNSSSSNNDGFLIGLDTEGCNDKNRKYNGNNHNCSHCGSYGLNSNMDNTINTPCLVVVDVNGDRKPFPQNAQCFWADCSSTNVRKYGDPNGTKLTDIFTIMITDKQAIPYGVAAQRAMYQAQKSK